MFVAIHSALLAFIIGEDATKYVVEISSLGMALSLFGIFFSKKHHEKFCYHLNRARGYRDNLDNMLTDVSLEYITEIAKQKTLSKFPFMELIDLNDLWNMVHLLALITYFVIVTNNFT
ncbi:hypothetical protein ACET65_17405 [Aeromonas rivipollensis]